MKSKKEEGKNEMSLSDAQLDGVTGGGSYYPVSGCIKKPPITKLVWWFLNGVDYSACQGCPLLDQLSTGPHCRMVSGNSIWE